MEISDTTIDAVVALVYSRPLYNRPLCNRMPLAPMPAKRHQCRAGTRANCCAAWQNHTRNTQATMKRPHTTTNGALNSDSTRPMVGVIPQNRQASSSLKWTDTMPAMMQHRALPRHCAKDQAMVLRPAVLVSVMSAKRHAPVPR
jgi:hypothetical protein